MCSVGCTRQINPFRKENVMSNSKKKQEEEIYRSLKNTIHFGPAVEIGPNPKVIDLTPQIDVLFRKVAKNITRMNREKE